MADNKNMGSGGGSKPGNTRDFDEQGRNRSSGSGNMGGSSGSMGSKSGHRGSSPSGRTSGSSSGSSDRDLDRKRGPRDMDDDISE
jgi:hypothetical protein